MKKIAMMTLTATLILTPPLVEAKRLGGGASFGRQSGQVSQRQSAPPAAPAQQNTANNAPQNPQQAGQAAQRPATAPAAASAASSKKPWGAMLGGLAAGLGLAWLANSLGLGEAFGNILLMALLAMAALAVFRLFKRSAAGTRQPLAYAAASPDSTSTSTSTSTSASATSTPVHSQGEPPQNGRSIITPPQYKPETVGNDASARPWEQFGQAAPASAATGSLIGSALANSPAAAGWGIPADFDAAGFLAAAKHNFLTLQQAWDVGDIAQLRALLTDEMLQEIRQQLAEREAESAGAPNITHIEGLQAQLLGIEDEGDSHLASVEFSGMSREELGAGLSPFREVWNMTKPKDGSSGWLVAGLQALA